MPLFGPDNFLRQVKNVVTGDRGFKKTERVDLRSAFPAAAVTATAATLTDNSTGTANTTIADITSAANAGSADVEPVSDAIADLAAQVNALIVDMAALLAQIALTADETNARVLKVEETVDTAATFVWVVPKDYDQTTDELVVRVFAHMVSVSTDTDVELDMTAYVKPADGGALGADLNPTAPGTILSTTGQWIEFDLSGNSLVKDDALTVNVVTNGANDTNGEEVLISGIEVEYLSTLVAFDKTDR